MSVPWVVTPPAFQTGIGIKIDPVETVEISDQSEHYFFLIQKA
jgi:hypothetical protein